MITKCSKIVLVVLLMCWHILYAQENQNGFDSRSLESLLETEISTAAKYAQTSSQAAASVTIITADEIRTQGYKTLTDVLASVRSFYITNDRNYGYIGVRGFGRLLDMNIRTLILLNGHTLNENVFGSSPAGSELQLDLSSVEKIEIVRGPGSALYGTGALLAVINIVTKRGNIIDDLIVSGGAGSFGKSYGNILFGNDLNDYDITLSASILNWQGQDLYYPEYDDSLHNYGKAIGLDGERGYGLLSTIEKSNLKFQLFASWREKGIPTGAYGVTYNGRPSKSIDSWNNMEIAYNTDLSASKHIYWRAYYDHYFFKGWYPYEVLNNDKAIGDLIGSELQLRWDFSSHNRLTIGGEAQDNLQAMYRAWSSEVIIFDKNATSSLYSVYFQDEYQLLDNLSLMAGIRRDRYSHSVSSTTPRLAIVYNPFKPSTLKLLYGKAFRKPTIYEAYYSDEDAGNKPNLSLKPEIIETYEFDVEQRLSANIHGFLSYYHYHLRDLIDQTLDPSDSLLQFRNIDKAAASGVESELRVHFPENGLFGYVSYSYQLAKNTILDAKLANCPEHIFKFGGSHPIGKYFIWGADFLYESDRITVNDTKTESYFLTNTNLICAFAKKSGKPKLGDRLELSIQIKNVFNINYFHPASLDFIQSSIRQNGRFVGATLQWKL